MISKDAISLYLQSNDPYTPIDSLIRSAINHGYRVSQIYDILKELLIELKDESWFNTCTNEPEGSYYCHEDILCDFLDRLCGWHCKPLNRYRND